MTPLESLALQTPVLVSDIGPHREVLGKEFCLPLVVQDWLVAIKKIEDSAHRRTLIDHGAKIVDAYSWQRSAETMTTFLAQL